MAGNSLLPGLLSGDVTQMWAALFRSMSQVGLVNVIQQMQTQDPDLEQRIVTEGFSYGKQLGRIVDAVDVLVRHAKEEGSWKLKPEEAAALKSFQDMEAAIDELKVDTVPLSQDGLDEFVRRMKRLAKRDVPACRRVREQIERLHERLTAELGPLTGGHG